MAMKRSKATEPKESSTVWMTATFRVRVLKDADLLDVGEELIARLDHFGYKPGSGAMHLGAVIDATTPDVREV